MDVIVSPDGGRSPGSMAQKTLSDLPIEIQKNICSQASSSDLIALALVSRHFHSVACAQLYRSFSIVFPDEDDPTFDSPIDGLAGGLDTMVTANHDYASYLKEITMDTLTGGGRGERAYRDYSYGESCGKFLNTLLVLTLRRAKALETFHWNVRIELSRQVFQVLHTIRSLQHLHVRLHAGPSLYTPPPPLPSLAASGEGPSPHHSTSFSTTKSPITPAPPSNPASSGPTSQPKISPSEDFPLMVGPPTFSKFESLCSLAILDMDTLDHLPEISKCIQNSTSTLKKFKLSLSETIANKARPPAADDSDESDVDDPEPSVIPGDGTLANASAVEAAHDKESRIKTERLRQEAVLGRIFGLDGSSSAAEGPSAEMVDQPDVEDPSNEGHVSSDPEDAALTAQITKKLVKALTDFDLQLQGPDNEVRVFRLILKAVQDFVRKARDETGASAGEGAKRIANQSTEESAAATGGSGKGKEKESRTSETASVTKADATATTATDSTLFTGDNDPAARLPATNKASSEEIEVDLEHPDFLETEEMDGSDKIEQLTRTIEKIQAAALVEGRTATKSLRTRDDIRMSGGLAEDVIQPPMAVDKTSVPAAKNVEGENIHEDADERMVETDNDPDRAMKDYVRSTRKLALRSLALHLVPIRASVLSRAVELSHLHRITLLNVGPQTPFWTRMHEMNGTQPLQLQCIYTDHVTLKFLSFARSLKQLSELFLLERSSKSGESHAGRMSVKIKDIRRLVLRKHMKTLKRVLIKNEYNYDWDVDVKTMNVLVKQGVELTELAISMSLRSFHLMLQFMPGLVNLRALHIVSFRTDDTCTWVMRELRKFAIDVVAHHPQLKLEFIGLDGTVERLLRTPTEVLEASKKGFIREKEEKSVDSDTDSDDDDGSPEPLLRIETREQVKFYDVYDVRIFRKDVRAGTL
ncbi:MAG: hypothetical protein M1817_002037 [Caeruleum heppii]|nr:MAG: hypothetical protein M1817_002037 [Caeruleum heppii]